MIENGWTVFFLYKVEKCIKDKVVMETLQVAFIKLWPCSRDVGWVDVNILLNLTLITSIMKFY